MKAYIIKFSPPKVIRLIAIPATMILYGFALGAIMNLTLLFIHEYQEGVTGIKGLFGLLLLYAGSGYGFYILWIGLWDKLFSSICVEENRIVWKCPLRKKRTILKYSVNFIGVEAENAFNGLEYPFIYISRSPFPKEFSHKIDKLPCRDGFLKFWYTDEFAAYLLTHFSNEQTKSLAYYQQVKKQKRKTTQ